MRDTAGNPERVRQLHLAHSGSFIIHWPLFLSSIFIGHTSDHLHVDKNINSMNFGISFYICFSTQALRWITICVDKYSGVSNRMRYVKNLKFESGSLLCDLDRMRRIPLASDQELERNILIIYFRKGAPAQNYCKLLRRGHRSLKSHHSFKKKHLKIFSVH